MNTVNSEPDDTNLESYQGSQEFEAASSAKPTANDTEATLQKTKDLLEGKDEPKVPKSKPSKSIEIITDLEGPTEAEINLHAAMAAVTKMWAALETIPDDATAICRELAISKRNKKGSKALAECMSQVEGLDLHGRIRPEVSELNRWLGEIENYVMGVGSAQPREQAKQLVRRLRTMNLPQRLAIQLDQVNNMGTEAAFKQLQVGKSKDAPAAAFSLLSQELEILDAVVAAAAAGAKALKLDEVQVKYCVEQLEHVQQSMVVMQALPLAVPPLVEKLTTMGDCHQSSVVAAQDLSYVLKQLIKKEDQTMDKRLKRFTSDLKKSSVGFFGELQRDVTNFFGLSQETLLTTFLLIAAVTCCFLGVCFIGYALLGGQSLNDRKEMFIGVCLIALGAFVGVQAIIVAVMGKFGLRRVHADDEDDDEDDEDDEARKKAKKEKKEKEKEKEKKKEKKEDEPPEQQGWSAVDVQPLDSGTFTAQDSDEDEEEKTVKVKQREVPKIEKQKGDTPEPAPAMVNAAGNQDSPENLSDAEPKTPPVDRDKDIAGLAKDGFGMKTGDKDVGLSGEELSRYAKHLGIDPVYDADLLWIAEQAYIAPLPVNWEEHHDEESNIFYYNYVTGVSVWTHPLEDHFRSLYIKLKVEKEKTARLEAKFESRRDNHLGSSDEEDDHSDDDGSTLGGSTMTSMGGSTMTSMGGSTMTSMGGSTMTSMGGSTLSMAGESSRIMMSGQNQKLHFNAEASVTRAPPKEESFKSVRIFNVTGLQRKPEKKVDQDGVEDFSIGASVRNPNPFTNPAQQGGPGFGRSRAPKQNPGWLPSMDETSVADVRGSASLGTANLLGGGPRNNAAWKTSQYRKRAPNPLEMSMSMAAETITPDLRQAVAVAVVRVVRVRLVQVDHNL
eukprot:gene2963-3779_t